MELKEFNQRFPRLDSVFMVEDFISENSGRYSVFQIWKRLPKKMMYQTYKLIISYLIEINKIAIDSDNKIGSIWNKKLGQFYKKKFNLSWD